MAIACIDNRWEDGGRQVGKTVKNKTKRRGRIRWRKKNVKRDRKLFFVLHFSLKWKLNKTERSQGRKRRERELNGWKNTLITAREGHLVIGMKETEAVSELKSSEWIIQRNFGKRSWRRKERPDEQTEMKKERERGMTVVIKMFSESHPKYGDHEICIGRKYLRQVLGGRDDAVRQTEINGCTLVH